MSSKNILQKHMADIHCEMKPFCCKESGKVMSSKNILQRHITNINHCDTIEEETANEYEILGHVIKHQVTKEPIKVSETADEVVGDNVNEVYDEKH